MTSSVIPMIKRNIIDSLTYVGQLEDGTHIPSFTHSLLPAATAIVIPSDFLDGGEFPNTMDFFVSLRLRIVEAKIALLAEFLEESNTDPLSYKMAETIREIGTFIPRGPVHESHQIRFANAIHRVSGLDEAHGRELLDQIINTEMFEVYAGVSESHLDDQFWFFASSPTMRAWLDSPTARLKIKDALSGYANKFASSVGSPLLPRVKSILLGLDSLHESS